jgi:hypothetical protein
LLSGRVDIPRLVCDKTIFSHGGPRIIPIAIKKSTVGQKFKIPFRNLSDQEIEVDFSLHDPASL